MIFPSKKISGSYHKQTNGDIWFFQTRTIFLKMSKFVAGAVNKM